MSSRSAKRSATFGSPILLNTGLKSLGRLPPYLSSVACGDYAHQGVTSISIIDTNSFWIDGYFEETKMARVCTGARVEAKLMGYSAPIIGHVKTITRGLSVSNAAAGAQGLPNVDPVYTWVRLAQRVPVRIAID